MAETFRVAWRGEDGPRPDGPTATLESQPGEGDTIRLDDGTPAAVEFVQLVEHWRPIIWARRLPEDVENEP